MTWGFWSSIDRCSSLLSIEIEIVWNEADTERQCTTPMTILAIAPSEEGID